MKKLTIFFGIHIFIIFSLSVYLFIDAAFNKDKKLNIYFFGTLKKKVYDSPVMRPYMILSGINTGYGFYGINVATNKYFLIEVLDDENNVVDEINVSNFKTSNSFSRFHTLPSWIYNFKVETNDIKELKNTELPNDKYIELRETYIRKIFKHILKSYIEKPVENRKYLVKLVTVVPPDIWKEKLEKNNIYVLEEFEFENEEIFKK